MGRVRQIDPWSKGQCVNSSITGDTSQADAQQSAEWLIHLSLQLPEAPSQHQSRATAGSRRADPPRTHPSFMGCNPRPEWVTGCKRDWQGGRTMELDVCIHVWVSLSFGVRWCGALCQLVPDSQKPFSGLVIG
ncbi:hypothetical protein PBY51_008689 [Eleginops maclovinus]|uniref:Uncharacterized protein n=1 Tax=Eleginops maclovinus TaxID=56733 RepID=A0AAN8AAP6_ELEMC|nr:hypothetical protein PBY51_008689 [Eleginops maclovinus]